MTYLRASSSFLERNGDANLLDLRLQHAFPSPRMFYRLETQNFFYNKNENRE
jgi:hypothetical protein